MKKRRIFLLFFSLFVSFFLNICRADNGTEIDIFKKITSFSIKEAMKSSKSIDELAEKVGITGEELKRICFVLSINLDIYEIPKSKPAEPVKLPPVTPLPFSPKSTEEMLVSSEYEPDVIVEYNGASPYIIFVEKTSHKIYVVKYENGNKTIMEVFDCKTGKNPGDKKIQGDHKTPEGMFYLLEKMNRSQLERRVGKSNAYQYGDLAFVTDYPNMIDQLNDKNGSGIWLHGTDEPFTQTSSLDTRGCVVTTNKTIKILSNYIELKRTPLVIVEKLNFVEKNTFLAVREEILKFMEKWRVSWEKKNIDDYIGCYASSFEDRGRNLASYKQYKTSIFKTFGINHVKIEDLVVIRHSNGMIAQFNQDYSADNLSSVNLKMLYLVQKNGSWEIAAEKIRN